MRAGGPPSWVGTWWWSLPPPAGEARWTPTAWRGVVDGVWAAEPSPVGSPPPAVLEELNMGRGAPELGGPAGFLCLSVSLPLLVRSPRGPPLVPPSHAHPNDPAANLPAGAPGGLTRLSHPSPLGFQLSVTACPSLALPAAMLNCLLPGGSSERPGP